MKILNQGIADITFDDVVTHCQNKIPEGVELDYKEDFPRKDLSRLYAAFSNTRGGLIIVGVKEDRQSGCPIAWDGIKEDAKLVEQANQLALSITPLPNYEIKMTDVKEGNVFILIRIYEGDATPYFVKNDSNIWMRTGNIRNPVDIASPEWQELLYKKRARADKARKNYKTLAENVFKNALELEEKNRLRLISEAKQKGDGSEKNYFQEKLGTGTELCKIIIQPNFPNKAHITPQEIKDNIDHFRQRNQYTEFPRGQLKPMPEGVYAIKHAYDGHIECQQIYSTGLMYLCTDVVRNNDGKSTIYITYILGGIFTLLSAARDFYNYVGYQGVIKLSISLELKSKDVYFYRLTGSDPFSWGAEEEALLSGYSWDYSFNSSDLNDKNEIFKTYFEIAKDIHWSLGFEHLDVKLLEYFMQKNNLNF